MTKEKALLLLIVTLDSLLSSIARNYLGQSPSNDSIVPVSSIDYVDASLFKRDDSLLCALFPDVAIKCPRVEPRIRNYTHTAQFHFTPNDAVKPNYLIIVKQSLYDSLRIDIDRYAEDVHTVFGYGIYLETVAEETPEDIKSLILSYQNNLCGVLFVGSIAEALYEVSNDHNKYGYKYWPCDLFFMDLDGIWTDSDSNGRYDGHSGNVAPEIYLGRLSAYGLSSYGNEENLIRRQLQKSHKYWWKSSYHTQETTLNYKDVHWRSVFNQKYVKKVFSTEYIIEVKNEIDSCFSVSDYLSRLASNTYGFTHLAAHSTPTHHEFCNGNIYDKVYNYNIKNIDSNNYAYSLFCCSACNWIEYNSSGYMGGAYLFNNGKTIAVVGTTKIGGMRSPTIRYFYPNLEYENLGEAFLNWWAYFGNTPSDINVYWNYGMTILGDPTIDFRYKVSNQCVNNLILTTFPIDNTSNMIMFKAGNKITVSGSFVIPQGVHVIFDAPQVTLDNNFFCPLGASFEIRNEGCEL